MGYESSQVGRKTTTWVTRVQEKVVRPTHGSGGQHMGVTTFHLQVVTVDLTLLVVEP